MPRSSKRFTPIWPSSARQRRASSSEGREAKAKLLFAGAKKLPASAAIVPLEKEKDLGMLVLGSADPERFQPRQGRLFLDMTADLVSAAVRARLG